MISELYQPKERRDEAYKAYKSMDKRMQRGPTGPCFLHPQYVKDFVGVGKDTIGIGNAAYRTYFKQLYKLEEDV